MRISVLGVGFDNITMDQAVAEGVSTALSVVAHLDLEGGMIFDEEGEV